MKAPIENSIRTYLVEIGSYPLLKTEEEIALARKIAPLVKIEAIRSTLTADSIDTDSRLDRIPTDDEWAAAADLTVTELHRQLAIGRRAKNKLVNANLRLVVSIAKKYKNRDMELMDLIQEGSIGLIRAAEMFDHTKGYKFSTYAYWWIRQGITRAIADQSRTIRLPVHMGEALNKIKKTTRILTQEQGRNPTREEIADRMEISIEKLDELMGWNHRVISGNSLIGKEENAELFDFVKSDDSSADDFALSVELSDRVHEVLETIPERSRAILRSRYGLDREEPKTLSRIGEELGICRETVRKVAARTMRVLKQPNNQERLREWL